MTFSLATLAAAMIDHKDLYAHPELSGCITTLTVRNANFCAAMDTLIGQDAVCTKITEVKLSAFAYRLFS